MNPFLRLTYDEGISRLCSFFAAESEKDMIKIYASKSKMTLLDNRWYIHSLMPPIPSYPVYNLISALQNVAEGKRVLMNVDLSITGRCHCRCVHCFRTRSQSDISLQRLKELLNTFSRMRLVNIELTGGEPLLRDDLEEILADACRSANVILYTTGHKVDIQRARRLRDLGLRVAVISLDHYIEREHNLRRRYKGAFKEALNAVKFFNDVGIYTAITVVPMGGLLNEKEMYKYCDFARQLEAKEVRVALPIPTGRLFGQDLMGKMKDFRRELSEIQDKINRDVSYPTLFLFQSFESREIMGCGAGFFYCAINNTGDVFPCVAIPVSFGNVLQEDFDTIWERMGATFKTPGTTCFGRRLSSVIKPIIPTMDRTIQIEELESVKNKLIVDDQALPFVFTLFKGKGGGYDS